MVDQIRLGYACISMYLRKINIFTSRNMILKTINQTSIDKLYALITHNLQDLLTILKFNESLGIRFFRISSGIYPHIDNINSSKKYTIDFSEDLLKKIGSFAKKNKHRLSMHPGQYIQLGSLKQTVITSSLKSLIHHANILASMQLTPNDGSCIIIHAGGHFGDKLETLKRWVYNFHQLDSITKSYIVLENDEIWSVIDLLPICQTNNIPLCIDFFHHTINGQNNFNIFNKKLLEQIFETWLIRNIKPKCHYSQQEPGKRQGAHSNKISNIPSKILNVCKLYNCDIMLESKLKDLNVITMYKKYFEAIYDNNNKIYWVLKK